jgi:antitoxin ParD1/3/4
MESSVPTSSKRTFSLPSSQAAYIDRLVASGDYASGSEVIRAGLRALQERDLAMEKWLREEVLPVAAAMEADPSRGVPIERVRKNVRAHHARRLRNARRGA